MYRESGKVSSLVYRASRHCGEGYTTRSLEKDHLHKAECVRAPHTRAESEARDEQNFPRVMVTNTGDVRGNDLFRR